MRKILFIDDEPDQIMIVRTRLEALGYKVISALDGEEGLTKAAEERPDLILLDLVMPVMDGYEVCGILKKNRLTRDIPVVVITGFGTENAEEMFRHAKADGFIPKPYDTDKLVKKINSLLDKE